ncbi:cytochrome P450 [Streptomyces eurythermus]
MPHIDDIDITDPRFYAAQDPHPVFERLRREKPIFFHEEEGSQGYWVLLKHDDQSRVHRNPGTFTTEYGVTFDTFRGDRRDPAAGKMLEFSVPGHHKVLRREFNKHYNRRAMTRMEDQVRTFARRTIDAALAQGEEFDFAAEIADRVTSAVVFGLLGFPERDWPELFDLSRRSQEETNANTCPVTGHFDTSANAANHELLKYLMRLLASDECSGHLKMLASLRFDDKPLTDEETILNCLNIMQGGNSTTRHAASGGILALIQNPDQAELLREDRSLLPGMVEETVRWTTPAIHFIRKATRDVEVRGQKIRKGDAVTVWTISANRDEDVFEDPYRFDIRRSPNKHLGFIAGPHICLGIHLARLEMRILFDEFLNKTREVELREEVRRVPSNFIAGIESLRVGVKAA